MKTKNALSTIVLAGLAAGCNEKPAPSYSKGATSVAVTTTVPTTTEAKSKDTTVPPTTVPPDDVISGKGVVVEEPEGPHLTLTGSLAPDFYDAAGLALAPVAPATSGSASGSASGSGSAVTPAAAALPAGTFRIWALPITGGSLDGSALAAAVTADVGADHKFELHLPKPDGNAADYLFAVIDPAQTDRAKQFVAQLAAVAAADGPHLFRLPLGAVKAGAALDFGAVAKDADGKLGLATLSGDGVKVLFADADAFNAAALIQTSYAALRGLYANASDTGYYSAVLSFGWDKLAPSAIIDEFSDPNVLKFYERGTTVRPLSYNVSVRATADTAPRLADICPTSPGGSPSARIALVPPGGVETGGKTGVLSIGNDGVLAKGGSEASPSCSNGKSFIAYEGKDGAKPLVRYDFGADFAIKAPLPEGEWKLVKDSKTSAPLAVFDFDWASPLDAAGKPRVFIPSLKASVDTERVLTGLELKWYLYDGSKSPAYVEVPGASVAASVSGFKLFLRDANGNNTFKGKKIEEVFDDPATPVSDTKLKNTWKFRPDARVDDPQCIDDTPSNTDPDALVDNVGVSYTLGGVTYSWVWGKLPAPALGQTLCP